MDLVERNANLAPHRRDREMVLGELDELTEEVGEAVAHPPAHDHAPPQIATCQHRVHPSRLGILGWQA
jgi:hypothetical protein